MGSIIKVDKGTGRWEAIPTQAINDRRIALDSLGLLVVLLAKPHGWIVHPAQIRKELGIGKDRWARLRTDLTAAGYWATFISRDGAGKIEWEHIIRPIPTSPISGLPGDGRTTDGQPISGLPGDIEQINTIHTEINKTDRQQENCLSFSPELAPGLILDIKSALKSLPVRISAHRDRSFR